MNENLTNKKYLLQKIAKVISIMSLLAAAGTGVYILFLTPEQQELTLTLGVVAFFFASMAVVLYAIAAANLPDLSLKDNVDNMK
jgi:CHASE2 domain-containing sensor protein